MQLKDLAKVSEATSIINETFNKFSYIPDGNLAKNKVIIDALSKSTQKYSNEILIATINQGVFSETQARQVLQTTTLNTEQIETALSTAALSASQATSTSTTLGLGTAFKGLGISIKNTTKAMWTWMTTNPVGLATAVVAAIGALTFGIYKLHDAIDVTLEEHKEKLKDAKDAWNDVGNELKEVETELQNTNEAIKELEELPNLTWVEQEELDRLREVTKELELQKQLKQDDQLSAAEDLYKESRETFNKQFGNSIGNSSVDALKQQLSTGNISGIQLDLEDNLVDIEAMLQYLNETKEQLTDGTDIQIYESMIANLVQAKTDLIKSQGREMLSSISEYKQNILDIASVRDLTEDEQATYDYLSSVQKMIYEFYSPATWNSLEFDSIFDTKGLEKTKEELIAMAKAGELSPEVLQSFPKLNAAIRDSELIVSEGSDIFREFYDEITAIADRQLQFPAPEASFPDLFSLQNADNILTSLGKISESVDNVQNAYRVLSSAIDEYEQTGAISTDTLQSVMVLGDNWLDYLSEENGALSLNCDSLEELTRLRLEEMRVRALNNVIDNVQQIRNNADANLYLASTNYATAESFEELARTSMLSAKASLDARLASGELSQQLYDAVTAKMYGDINKINILFDNVTTGLADNFTAASSHAVESARSFSDLLDKELTVLDKKMEAGYTDFKDYIRDRLALIEDYYRQSKISADEYYSYLENHYAQELSYRDKAINAVTKRIDREINSLEKEKAAISDSWQTRIDALEEQKNLLQDANSERRRQLDLQKALYNLERAKNQRTALVYSEDGGMRYVTDEAALRDAETTVENAEYEIRISKIEKGVTELEQARDAETAAIDDMIDSLREYREQWNDITSAYEENQENLIAAQILGQEWESDILNCRLDTLSQFRDEYISIQQAMADAAWESANAQISAAREAAKGAEGNMGNASVAKNPPTYEVVDESTARTVRTFDSLSTAQEYAAKLSRNIPDTEPSYYVLNSSRYHTGLRQGPVSSHSFDEDFRLVRQVGLGNREVPAILKEGEAVATPEQISRLAAGLRQTQPIDPAAESITLSEPIITSDGHMLRPLQPGDRIWELQKAFEPLVSRILNDGEILVSNAILDGQRQMEQMTSRMHADSVNTRSIQPNVQIGDIHISCPGITDREVAEQVGVALNEKFRGFHLYAEQQSMIRR
ncbi:MAG: hypothetical protein NC079_00640 [Clostridium sp.]|nr:hypothetical protein [Acetatifactor muris]MCM1527456.1 hypothetical protein [Bacteroides sp.]MCM1562098.1 hypothetical protein [Clostridium sp.]